MYKNNARALLLYILSMLNSDRLQHVRSVRGVINIRDFAFFVFERTKHQPRGNLRSYLVLQRLCNEAALSPGIDVFWY